MNKKTFWSKLRSPLFPSKRGKSIKDGEEKNGLSGKLNVNEEYKEVFRTQSYAEIWSKVQVQLKKSTLDHKPSSSPLSSRSPLSSFSNSCSPLPLYVHLSDCLLEPRQEAVIDIIKSSDLKVLLVDYFEASLEAYNVCELLLGGIQKTRSNHRLIKRVIKLSKTGGNDEEEGRMCLGNKIYQFRDKVVQDLACFTRQSNPLSIILNGEVDFRKIHDKYTLLLQNLTARRRKIKRREKLTRFFKKVAGYSFVATYVVLTITVLALAMHSVVGLLGAPGLLMASSSSWIKKARRGKGGPRVSWLEKLASQLDVAAKGVYILINDFDTVGRLVMGVHDEVEHMRALAEMCVRSNKNQELIKEALRELNVHEDGLVEQLEELEEHIYLCFLTINRSRRLVIQEILACPLDC